MLLVLVVGAGSSSRSLAESDDSSKVFSKVHATPSFSFVLSGLSFS